VQCKDSSIDSISSGGTIDFDFSPPTLVAPENNSEQDRSVSFEWKEIEAAEFYQIRLAGVEDFSEVLADSMADSTGFEIQGLPYDSTIYWQVRPIVNDELGPWSDKWQFKTIEKPDSGDNADPIAAKLKSPENGATEQPTNVSLKWTAIASASAYELQLASDQNFSSIIVDKEVKSSSFQTSNLDNQVTYYWKVKPVISDEKTEWSEIYEFVTQPEAEKVPPVNLVSPEDGAKDLTTSVTLEWQEISGISEYRVQLSTSSSFSSTVADESTNQLSFEVSSLEKEQSYYWRVQAIYDGDNKNWSTVRNFTTQPEVESPDGPNSVSGDRQALVDLYNATGGDNWSNNSGWLDGDPSDNWYGVEVNANGRVVRLDLSGNNLSGTLPESIGNLSKVTYFNVKQNKLSGQIPSSIGNMASLTHLLLNGRTIDMNTEDPQHPGKPPGGSWAADRSNNFTGQLPASIGELTNLEWLELNGTGQPGEGLEGAIPSSIGKLTNLKGLQLAFNRFSSLPSTMGNLTNLINLAVADQGVDGNRTLAGHGFPQWISDLTNLKFLWMQDNEGMGGSLPDMSALTNLEIILLDFCGLTGEIPREFYDGTMPNINMTQLAWNNFSGTMPEIKKPNNLKAFTINGNKITGTIPDSWGTSAAGKMINFGLAWNQLEGPIPDLSHMRQLRYVRVNNNNFTGTIPMVDTSNKNLQFLHFHNNQFSGEIPAELAEVVNLPKFRDLNISNNKFSDLDMQALIDSIKPKSDVNFLKSGTQRPDSTFSESGN
jgi:Leucine-rich repeat (LRR) protein